MRRKRVLAMIALLSSAAASTVGTACTTVPVTDADGGSSSSATTAESTSGGDPCASLDCDDHDVCTDDACTDGKCSHEPTESLTIDQTVGDCKRLACEDKAIQTVPDDDDLPAADTNPCTRDICVGGEPNHDPTPGAECGPVDNPGQCVIDPLTQTGICSFCASDADCGVDSACVTYSCDVTTHTCSSPTYHPGALAGGESDGDCKALICVSGSDIPTSQAYDADVPVDAANDCIVPGCSAGTVVPNGSLNLPGTACSADGSTGACSASGACIPPECADGRQFQNPVTLSTPGITNFFWITSADLDGDSNDDLLLQADTAVPRPLLLLRGHRDGTFDAPVTIYDSPYALTEPAAADLDGDGKLDIVSAVSDSSMVAVFRNLGGGSFAAPVTIATGMPASSGGALSVGLGDVNNDGKVDAVAGGSAWVSADNGAVTYGLSTTGAATSHALFSLGNAKMWSGIVTDLDHTGGKDAVFSRFTYTNGGITVALSNGSGLGAGTPYNIGNSIYPIMVRAGDVNGDGWNDVVTGNWATGSVSVWTNQGNGTLSGGLSTPLGYSGCNASSGCLWAVDVRDLNGDGRADITSVGINDNRFSVLLATSGGAFPAVSEFHSVGAGSAPRALVSGNFTKDARPDVVVTTGTAGAVLFKHCP
ncbi:MAG: VCBS repeat-containing protein [Polyangiaceae bacterium]